MLRASGGGKSPACASELRTRGTSRPAGEGPYNTARGARIKDETDAISDATSAVPGSWGEGAGVDLLLSPRATPL